MKWFAEDVVGLKREDENERCQQCNNADRGETGQQLPFKPGASMSSDKVGPQRGAAA